MPYVPLCPVLTDSHLCPLHPDKPSSADLNHLFFEQELYLEALKLDLPAPLRATDLVSSDNILMFLCIIKFISNVPTSVVI